MTQEKKAWLIPSVFCLLIWGVWGFLPKLALQTLPPQDVLFYEAIGNMAVVLPILLFFKGKLDYHPKGLKITFVSGVLNALAVLAFCYALKDGPVSVIVTLTALYPVITLFLAYFILQEKMGLRQILGVALAMIAIILLTS